MICPYCHHEIDDEAVFCPECGHPLEDATSAAPAKKFHVKAIAIVVAVVCLVAGAAWWHYDQQQKAAQIARERAATLHGVKVTVSADGWDTAAGASKLPVKVSGTKSDGSSVDEVQYVDSTGAGIELSQGTYELVVVASPIAADGTVYTYPDNTIACEVGDLDPDATIDLSAESGGTAAIALSPVAALDVTDGQLSDAAHYAILGGVASDDAAKSLRDAATKRRDDAIAQKKAEEAKAARHVTAQTFQLDLPAYWDGRVKVTVEGDTVTVYSKKYSDMAVCSIEGNNGPVYAVGDIGSGCIADVELGGGKYAEIWMTRWGWMYDYQQNLKEKPSPYYSKEGVSELIDLQSGGRCTLADTQADSLCADQILLDLIKPSIRAL